jgi:hypothetical protein
VLVLCRSSSSSPVLLGGKEANLGAAVECLRSDVGMLADHDCRLSAAPTASAAACPGVAATGSQWCGCQRRLSGGASTVSGLQLSPRSGAAPQSHALHARPLLCGAAVGPRAGGHVSLAAAQAKGAAFTVQQRKAQHAGAKGDGSEDTAAAERGQGGSAPVGAVHGSGVALRQADFGRHRGSTPNPCSSP